MVSYFKIRLCNFLILINVIVLISCAPNVKVKVDALEGTPTASENPNISNIKNRRLIINERKIATVEVTEEGTTKIGFDYTRKQSQTEGSAAVSDLNTTVFRSNLKAKEHKMKDSSVYYLTRVGSKIPSSLGTAPDNHTDNKWSGALFEVSEPCHPSPCGVNAVCTERNGAGMCTCLPFHDGDPYNKCRRLSYHNGTHCEDKSFDFVGDGTPRIKLSICCPSPCGPNSTCQETTTMPRLNCNCLEGYVGSSPNCRPPECTDISPCPNGAICVRGICAPLA